MRSARVTLLAAAVLACAGLRAPAGRAEPGGVRFCALGGGRSARGTLSSTALAFPRRLPALSSELPDARAVPIRAVGVSEGAKSLARRLLDELLSRSPATLASNLGRARVFLMIVPESKRLTDLDEFKSLKGKQAGNGQMWDDVRGAGFVSQADGTVAVAAGEENFIPGDKAWKDPYPKGYLLVHEFSHCVHEHGLPRDMAFSIQKLYDSRSGAGGPFASRYAGSDVYEYFAVASNVYFRIRYDDGAEIEKDVFWLWKADPGLYAVLYWAYGASRSLGSTAPSLAARPSAGPWGVLSAGSR